MSRSVEAVTADVLSLAPTGWAWSRRSDRVWPTLLRVLASAIATVEASVDELRVEIDPARATTLLESFERVLGPDPCGLDDVAGSLGVRRAQAWRRWTWQGGASIAWFVALAAKYGVEITVETFRPLVCGDRLGAKPVIVSPEQFVWRVHLPTTWTRRPICGDQVCGDLLGEIGASSIECLFRHYAPAHTVPVFSYGA